MDEFLRSWLARVERWVQLHPVAGSPGLAEVADEIAAALSKCGLTVERYPDVSGDLLIARAVADGPLLGMYGHYDVEAGGRPGAEIVEGRVFGRGVGDNLGPLALRICVLERFRRRPNLIWVIEPGEEIGSHALADWLADVGPPQTDLWLDETGYFEEDGTQRILCVEPDDRAHEVARRCADLAASTGRPVRVEQRRLRRVVPNAGFSVEALFQNTPYLALGPNDDRSEVHGEMESLPLHTIDLSARQFELLLDHFTVGPAG